MIFVNIPPFFSFGFAHAQTSSMSTCKSSHCIWSRYLFRVCAENRHQLCIGEVVVVIVVKVVEEFVRVTIVVFIAHVRDPLPDNFDLQSKHE